MGPFCVVTILLSWALTALNTDELWS